MPRLVLFDTEAEAGPALQGSGLLIEPTDAIDLLATGTLTRDFPAKRWFQYSGDGIEIEIYTHSGRVDLAEELIGEALSSGRLRCIYVVSKLNPGRTNGLRVESIDPAQFAGHSMSIDMGDLGLRVSVDTEGAWFEAEGFLFLWDELCRLRPSLARLAGDTAEAPVHLPKPDLKARGSWQNAPTRRGRPSGRNGKPIAKFTLRVAANPNEFRSIETDDPLGAMLVEEYVRLGLSPPNLNNAAKDARGVVDAVLNSIDSAQN